MSHQEILNRFEFPSARRSEGALEVHSPIDGTPIATLPTHTRADVESMITRAVAAFKTWRWSRAAPRRTGAPVRRGTARREARPRRTGHARIRQDPAGRSRRSAGDDRHLRLRRGSVATALRADDGVGTSRARDARDVASGRRVRRHHRVQLPGAPLVLERGAGARLRRSGDLEAVREDAAVGARHTANLRPRARPLRRRAATRCRRCSSARPTSATRWSRTTNVRSSRRPDRRAWAAPSGRRSPRGSASASSNSAATTR